MKRTVILRWILVRKYESSPWWGLCSFITRGRTVELGLTQKICSLIEKEGFDVIDVKTLNDKEKVNFATNTRGGNWEVESGTLGSTGLPDSLIVAFDRNPTRPSGGAIKQWPELDNERVSSKTKLRAQINELVSSEYKANYIHASDNSFQAWKYINLCSDYFPQKVKNKITKDYIF